MLWRKVDQIRPYLLALTTVPRQPRLLGCRLPNSQEISYIGSKHDRYRKIIRDHSSRLLRSVSFTLPRGRHFYQGYHMNAYGIASFILPVKSIVAERVTGRRIAGKGNNRYSALKIGSIIDRPSGHV